MFKYLSHMKNDNHQYYIIWRVYRQKLDLKQDILFNINIVIYLSTLSPFFNFEQNLLVIT